MLSGSILFKGGSRRLRRSTVACCIAALFTLSFALEAGMQAQPRRGRAPAAPLPPVHPGARRSFTGILMWHDVVPRDKLVWFDTTIAELKEQFESIRKRGLTPITLEALADHLEKGSPAPPGAVVLTFDDNNLGLYRHLYPLARQYRWPVALFVHTDYVGVRTGKDHCTWDQLREMEKSGFVRVYPHTASHPPDLRKVSAEKLKVELEKPLQFIRRELGEHRPFFAYSEGHYNERVARAVLAAGYRLAITEDHGPAERSANLMMVNRYSMHGRAKQAIAEVAAAKARR